MSIVDVPPYGGIAEAFKNGEVVPFLGAGASLIGGLDGVEWKYPGADRLPSGRELRTDLVRLTSLPLSEASTTDLAAIAQYCSYEVGPSDLRGHLHEIFARPHQFGDIHRFLAEWPKHLVVVTTNYDELLERAFTQAGKPFDLVIHQTSDLSRKAAVVYRAHGSAKATAVKPNSLDIDLERASVIYKMHGTVMPDDPAKDSFVVTEDDYVDFLVRMGSTMPIPAVLRVEFAQSHFLFLGYGLSDWNFRVVLGTLRDELRQRKSWAIMYGTSRLEKAIWSSRNVLVYDMLIDDFVSPLKAALQ